jgi:phospholipase C
MTTRASTPSNRAAGQLPFPDLAEGSDNLPEINHILVLMMENHSYDSYLGMLGRGLGEQPRGGGF